MINNSSKDINSSKSEKSTYKWHVKICANISIKFYFLFYHFKF